MRFGGFGPWRPEWSMMRMPGLAMPVLGVLGLISESMGWGTQPEDVAHFLPPGGTLVPLEDSGHFVHIEHPRRVADLVLDFLGSPPTSASWGAVGPGTPAPAAAPAVTTTAPIIRLRHARAELALHELRAKAGRPLLLLHGLAERSPAVLPPHLSEWPGPVFALDFVGHGASTIRGGGATPPRCCWPTPTPRCVTSARRRCSGAASARTSRCCSPARGPTRCVARSCSTGRESSAAAPGRAPRWSPRSTPPRRRRRIRSRWPSCHATSDRPTTRRTSFDSRRKRRRSSIRLRSRRSIAPTGSRPWCGSRACSRCRWRMPLRTTQRA